MNEQIIRNRIITLKIAMMSIPLLGIFMISLGIWLLTLLNSPHANPNPKVILSAILIITLGIGMLLFAILGVPKILKKAEASLIEYEKMKEVYEKHKNDN